MLAALNDSEMLKKDYSFAMNDVKKLKKLVNLSLHKREKQPLNLSNKHSEC